MSKSQTLPVAFDAYEISGVRRFGRGKDRYCERVPDDEAQFWSLYGHIQGQGAECIGDYRTREFAEEVYARITGRRYGDTALKRPAATSKRDRANRCQMAIDTYEDEDRATNLIDILCDAQHWCDENGHDFHLLLATACRHYINELNGEQTDERRMP
jgi:hypothetical protein